MPVLPSSLSPVRVAVASLLLLPGHSGHLYFAKDIANALNNTISADDDPTIFARVDATTLLRAFANDATYEYGLEYHKFFGYTGNRDVLYVRREKMRDGARPM